MAYIPFDATEEEIAQKSIIRDDIPEILAQPLIGWLAGAAAGGGSQISSQYGLKLQLEMGLDFGFRPGYTADAMAFSEIAFQLGDQTFMRVIDYVLQALPWQDYEQPQQLLEYLDIYRSKFTVVKSGISYRVSFRLPSGIEETMQEAINAADATAGKLLSQAWEYAYGLDGKAEEAMDKAVKAVERAATPVVCPNHPAASLGNVIADVKQQGDWVVGLRFNAGAYPGVTLHHMMQTLWHGQQYRHVDQHAVLPTIEQARVHVMLAATLVGWFASGQVVRDSTLPQPKNWQNLQP